MSNTQEQWAHDVYRVGTNPHPDIINGCASLIAKGIIEPHEIRRMQQADEGHNILRLIVRDDVGGQGETIVSALLEN